MSNQILPDYSFRQPTGDPYCLYCGTPKDADGSSFCSDACRTAHAAALAASLPPLKIVVQTMRELREGKGERGALEYPNAIHTLYLEAERIIAKARCEMTTRTVRVIHRSPDGWYIHIQPVTVEWVCPKCGQPRGEPFNHNFCEDGEWFSCDRWDNPCGHIDKYVDVIAEGKVSA